MAVFLGFGCHADASLMVQRRRRTIADKDYDTAVVMTVVTMALLKVRMHGRSMMELRLSVLLLVLLMVMRMAMIGVMWVVLVMLIEMMRVRRAATAGSLAQCVSSCLFLHRSALAVEVTKLRLCVDNACDIMQVVDACDLNDPQAQYIQDIVMNFAAGNATVKAAPYTFSLALSTQAIVKSERFSSLDDALKSRLFVKLASMGLLKT
ncbi:hypothetical protein AK812_SmicGene34398 [Symbiodinium microadriaticum]|uniref:Uncharacterized protein n=1 Tax=Symbiodinium microadriaticum TaxID=2951 RepID=A0A1Q9CP44_SYMMI|nr:hypothetical protein AK812_SmicGene34398 [Symbiodinium microadriaticum]